MLQKFCNTRFQSLGFDYSFFIIFQPQPNRKQGNWVLGPQRAGVI